MLVYALGVIRRRQRVQHANTLPNAVYDCCSAAFLTSVVVPCGSARPSGIDGGELRTRGCSLATGACSGYRAGQLAASLVTCTPTLYYVGPSQLMVCVSASVSTTHHAFYLGFCYVAFLSVAAAVDLDATRHSPRPLWTPSSTVQCVDLGGSWCVHLPPAAHTGMRPLATTPPYADKRQCSASVRRSASRADRSPDSVTAPGGFPLAPRFDFRRTRSGRFRRIGRAAVRTNVLTTQGSPSSWAEKRGQRGASVPCPARPDDSFSTYKPLCLAAVSSCRNAIIGVVG